MIKAKKSLGQNFLIDRKILEKIVNVAPIKNKIILEIGPGTGNLTSFILKKKPKKLVVIEKDKDLVLKLTNIFNDQISVINDDVLNVNENLLFNKNVVVFGNLPYNISTEILSKWIINSNNNFWFDHLVLMFQKEVADRIISNHNSSNYGRLSIISNWKLKIEKIMDIKPYSFKPVPKVDSSLLTFTPKNNYKKICSEKSLEKITRIFFNQRRKKIKKPFYQIFSKKDKVLDKLNISLDLRPQNLDYETYLKLAREFEKLSS